MDGESVVAVVGGSSVGELGLTDGGGGAWGGGELAKLELEPDLPPLKKFDRREETELVRVDGLPVAAATFSGTSGAFVGSMTVPPATLRLLSSKACCKATGVSHS